MIILKKVMNDFMTFFMQLKFKLAKKYNIFFSGNFFTKKSFYSFAQVKKTQSLYKQLFI